MSIMSIISIITIISIINHSELGVMFTNLAIVNAAPRLVQSVCNDAVNRMGIVPACRTGGIGQLQCKSYLKQNEHVPTSTRWCPQDS